jgi:hypothetical protein
VLAALVTVAPAPAAASGTATVTPSQFESCLLEKINDARAGVGARRLIMATDVTDDVRGWSKWMRYNSFRHTTTSERYAILPDGAFTAGENIAWWSDAGLPDCSKIHTMFMKSSGHKANILNKKWRYVALGAYVDSSKGWWVTEIFFDASNYSPACEGTFCDDDGSMFEADIERMAAKGITTGCNPPTNNKFCPDAYVTRGQMAAFLARALNLTNRGSVDFADDNGHMFEADIERLATAGITRGCNPPSNTRFCPDSKVTRGQMAAFLARALNLTNRGSVDFTDDDGLAFEADIERIAAAGITKGCNPPSNTRFCPNDHLTRGQMAAFLMRALDL